MAAFCRAIQPRRNMEVEAPGGQQQWRRRAFLWEREQS